MSLIARALGRLNRRRVWAAAGLILLALWGTWWALSLQRGSLVGGERTWFRSLEWLGLDFRYNYYSSRLWVRGGDPYRQSSYPRRYEKYWYGTKYPYPPLVLRCFAWCGRVNLWWALRLWAGVVAAAVALAAYLAWRERRELGLWEVPAPLAVAAVLWSTPVLFEMERGNCNVLVLLLVVVAAWSLRRRAHWGDVIAGLALALAAWIKVYPGLLGVALLASRRWRAVLYATAAGILIGLLDVPGVVAWVKNLSVLTGQEFPWLKEEFLYDAHGLSAAWQALWAGSPLTGVRNVPGPLPWACLFLPLIFWVSRPIYRCPDPVRFIYPYFLWLAGVATFLPDVSWDYNLLFVPLAAVAVWDRRDPWYVHALMLPLLLWWQPVRFPIPPELFLCLKVLGVVGIGLSLRRRVREFGAAPRSAAPPAFAGKCEPAPA